MILRDAKAIKLGTTTINKIYSGTYKVYDKNKTALEGYCNQLQTTGKNLFDKTTANKLNAYMNTSGKILSSSTARTVYMECQPSTTYTISKIAGARFKAIATSTVPAMNVVGDVYEANDSGTSITITTAADSTYLAIYYWTSDHDTITEQEALDTLQVEIGSSASPYEPYSGGIAVPSPDHPQPIETMKGRQIAYGRNLLSPSLATTIQSYIANSDGNLVKDTNPNNKTVVFKVKPNTTYTVSKVKSNRFRMGTNPNEIESGTMYNKVRDDDATTLEISTGTDTYLYVFYWTNTDTLTEETIRNSIQIREKCIVDLKSRNLYEGSQDFSGTWGNSSLWEDDSSTYNNLAVKKRASSWSGIYKEIEVEQGKSYTFSCYVKGDSPATFGLYTSGGTSGIRSAKTNLETTTEWQRYSFTFTASASGTVRPRVENQTSHSSNYTYICGYQFEEAQNVSDYEPYYNYELAGIKSKNLLNPVTKINDTNIYTTNCTATVNNGVFTFTASGTNFNFGSGRSAGNSYINDRGFLMSVESSTTYAFSMSNTNFSRFYITEYDSSKISLGGSTVSGTSGTLTTKSNTKYMSITIFYTGATVGNTYSTTIQVEKSSTPTTYEPYHDDYTDTIFTREGKWYIGDKIAKIVLNGSESGWRTSTISGSVITQRFASGNNSLPNSIAKYSVCDKFKNRTGDMTAGDYECILINNAQMYISINISTIGEATVDNFKTWLSTHNTLVYYVLLAPTEEQITAPGLIAQLNALYQAM